MKRLILITMLCLFAGLVQAQKPLTNGLHRAHYTYVYRLNDASARLFYTGNKDKMDQRVQGAPLDSFATGHFKPWHLPAGNYVEVLAVNNQLTYELIVNRSAYLKLLDDNAELKFVLLDTNNKEINNARVMAGKHRVDYDAALHLYRAPRNKKDTLLCVVYQGVSNFYMVKARSSYISRYRDKRSWFSKTWARLKYDVRRLFAKKVVNGNTSNPGYMIFNKPKYKPNDTVKLKAFILMASSYKPIATGRLAVRLEEGYNSKGKILGYVNAYNPGGFEFSLKLNDSLKLRLDQSYNISLETADNPYDMLQNREAYNAFRKVYISGSFRYEDYELTSSKFEVRADKTEHAPGEPVSLYFRATDDNGLDIPDGRVTVTLFTGSVTQYAGQHVFVPDTLWKHQVKLDPVGETKLTLPDSVFPNARIGYRAQAVLLNSNNERREETKYLTYNNGRFQINHQLTKDTLTLSYLKLGKPLQAKAMLYRMSDGDETLLRSSITLPVSFAIDPIVAKYVVVTDSLTEDIKAEGFDAGIQINADHTADTLHVKVRNPRHLNFWYTIFAGDKVIDKGNADKLNYKLPVKGLMASVVLNYIWAGKVQSVEQRAEFKDRALTIDMIAPDAVYPGQQADIKVHVNDAKGKPVANVDLTAFAITEKFENYRLPNIPYFGQGYIPRKAGVPLVINKLQSIGSFKLNWQRWSKQMGLDTMEYYKFTHPADIYTLNEPTPDTTTQIAPFMVKDGDIVPVHILYVDGIPVYFSKTNDLQRYSFTVKPGMHNLHFRTADQDIRLNNVELKKHTRLILSLNADTVKNKLANFKAMPDTLTNYEAELINKYMTSIVPNFGDHLATITQNGRIFLLGMNNNTYSESYNMAQLLRRMEGMPNQIQRNWWLTGPVATYSLELGVKGQQPRFFDTEPGFSFQFEPGLIIQKSLPVKYPFTSELKNQLADTDYRQYALTKYAVDTLWQNYLDQRSHNTVLFNNPGVVPRPGGELTVQVGKLAHGGTPFVKNIIVYKNDDPDYERIYPGNLINLDRYSPGKYRILYLFKGNTYFLQENIIIKPYGKNFYSTGIITPHAPDSTSRRIAAIIEGRDQYGYDGKDVQLIKEIFNQRYMDVNAALTDEMSGYIYAQDDGLPLPGVNVRVSGIAGGTTTSANGYFNLKVPHAGKLILSFIGFIPEEIPIRPGANIRLYLNSSTMELHEVVVTAGGLTTTKGSMGYATVNYKMDTVAYMAADYKVRPNATLDELLKNMEGFEVGADGRITSQGQAVTRVRLNGKDYVGGDVAQAIKNLPADILEKVQVVDDYGDQAARSGIKDGDPQKILNVITRKDGPIGKILIITTTKDFPLGLDDPTLLAMRSIRKNFSDYAYWQPKLVTDAQGDASFKTTFPDDITQWRTYVIGMNGNRQSGISGGQIRAYKPLSANLTAPQFAVRGDVLNPIGKVLNYTTDTVHLKRTFKFNGEVISEENITVKNALIDTFKVTATGKDSLSFEYTVKKGSGYFDGESRAIPIFEQGSLETKGTFASLERDTTVTIQLNPKLKEGTFRAEASVLPALLDETEHLRNYEYLCNEQLASKLMGLLSERKIKTYLGEPFKYDKDINEMIKKLQDNRRVQGTWGWWKDSDEELWISLHAASALIDAEAQGFKTQLDKQKLVDYLLYQAASYRSEDILTVLLMLKKLGAKADYAGFIDTYIKQLGPKYKVSRYNALRLMLVQQQAGLPFKQDSLMKWMHQTMMGNVYWGDDSYSFFDNSIQESLLAYQLLKAGDKQPELLNKLRNYFLEQRKDGYWRNTYESAQILETILPDLLIGGKKPEPSVIVLSGAKNERVTQFPYTTSISGATSLAVRKTGTMPVYITAYQKFWNPEPEKVNKDFAVDTKFEKNGQLVTKAKGGEPINLQVEVTARADADFVMVEIPIPAGCSYPDKNQAYANNEVHREYFKNKVSIFCRKLSAGKHTFTISLTPRYGGTYHINPAKAEMMYFPVFYGREGMKVFSIE